MSTSRGLIPPAIVVSTIVLALCAVGWGVLAAFSIDDTLPMAPHRYLCVMLATVTICSAMVNLTARAVCILRTGGPGDGGYAAGYADGLDAHPDAPTPPAVSRLVPPRR